MALHDVFVGTDGHEVFEIYERVGLFQAVRLDHPVLPHFRTFENEGEMCRIFSKFRVVDLERVVRRLVGVVDGHAVAHVGRVFFR